jgi:hypothetical protein
LAIRLAQKKIFKNLNSARRCASTRVNVRGNSHAQKHIEDDGLSSNNKDKAGTSFWDSIASRFSWNPQPGTLILVRHGESVWNQRKLFTGWVDVDLSDRGVREIEHAARLLLAEGYSMDVTYTSTLKRAIRSVWILQNEIDQIYRPCVKSWRLNERM